MKLFLSAICASFLITPLSFAADCGDCKQSCDCVCECTNKQEALLADCGGCKKESDCGKKKDGACDKKDDAASDKKDKTLAAGCGSKCKKDSDADKKKEDKTVA